MSTRFTMMNRERRSVMPETVIIIPALNPDRQLVSLVRELMAGGLDNIVVVDDGSSPDCAEIFSEVRTLGCTVVSHGRNKGKGAALKTGIRTAAEKHGGNFYVTADADGQHLTADIIKVAQELLTHPECLVLGTRDFSDKDVPPHNRLGNRITSAIFRITCGKHCPDTQTGLRGIPPCLEELALSEEGNRYEYEMNFLMDASRLVEMRFVPIATVYRDGNKSSHFRVVADSVRVYGRFLRYVASSLTGAAADILLFYLLSLLFAGSVFFSGETSVIFAAAVLARICSGVVNYTMNRVWSFRSGSPLGAEAVRYGVLFVAQMCASAGLTAAFSYILPSVAAKIVVDTCLFFISYVAQKNWVFRK